MHRFTTDSACIDSLPYVLGFEVSSQQGHQQRCGAHAVGDHIQLV